jgi:hypothetical protein
MITLFLIPLISGCNNSKHIETPDTYLKNDAAAGLKGAYAEQFTRLTIIRGALNKYLVSPGNQQHLGTVIGAVEATVFPEEYELKRFEHLENLPAETRKEIISQPMLNITLKTREVLNHIYTAVLKPLASRVEQGKTPETRESAVLNNLTGYLDNLAQDYHLLSNEETDLNSIEAQHAFISIQNTLRELQKLDLIKQQEGS